MACTAALTPFPVFRPVGDVGDVSGRAVLPTAAGPCRHRTGLPPLRPRATSGAEPSKVVGGAKVANLVPSGTETTFGKAGGGVRHQITVTVNGTAHTAEVEPRTLLVHLLREQLDLTGTHIGCDTSSCGACTVLIDGETVLSCSTLAVQADGASITTVEGLSTNGELHPIQRAFHERHGLQCGFCTPGMMIAAVGLIESGQAGDEASIRSGLEGNLCRCTGYQNIVEAVQQAAAEMAGV